jgi:deazaflavin-dependent oxidoreductase (nitroreductase family)
MAEAKLAPNMPEWMVKHANLYLASGGKEGQMYKVNVPDRGEITAPALLLTTTGRKSGDKFIFPLFYGTEGDSYFVVASKGGAPEHPGWYRNILANPEVEVQVGTKKAAGFGRRRSCFGRLTPTMRSRPTARSRWSCWTPFIRSRAPAGNSNDGQTTPRMDGKEPQAHAAGG